MIPVVLILAVYAVAQGFGLHAPFLHGDDQNEVAFINGLDSWWRLFGADCFGLFRPIKNFLFLGFSAISSWGMEWCRAIAIAIGVASFFPVRAFFRRIFGDERRALLAAAVWLLSPTLMSSVAWLSCVNIQLMCAFAALAFCLHIDGKTYRAAVAILLACLSYELAVVLGPALVAYDFLLREDRFRSRAGWRNYAGYALVTLGYLAVRAAVGCASEVNGSFVGCGRADLMLASAYFTLQHFYSWFLPFGRMAIFGSYTNGSVSLAVLLGSWAVLLLLAASVFVFRRRSPVYSFGMALAGIAFFPVGNFLGLGNGPYGDYYLGITSMGFSIAMVEIAGRIFTSAGLSRLALLVFGTIFLGIRFFGVFESARWVRCWCDHDLAYFANVSTFPKAYYPHVLLARVHCDHGRYAEALAECDVADALTGPNTDKISSSLLVRALCAVRGGGDAKAAVELLARAQAVDDNPKNQQLCHFYRGWVLEDLMNDEDCARREYERSIAIQIDTDNVEAANRLARLTAIGGDLPAAISLWERALKVVDDYAVRVNLEKARKALSAAGK